MSTFGHFRSKSINFTILAKFCMYLISNVLISNLTFVFENFETESLNMGILGQKYQLSNLNKILSFLYFESVGFKPDIVWKLARSYGLCY